jgi:hypothetical protein
MRRSFGPLRSVLLKRTGLTNIESREEMDQMVNSLLSTGL